MPGCCLFSLPPSARTASHAAATAGVAGERDGGTAADGAAADAHATKTGGAATDADTRLQGGLRRAGDDEPRTAARRGLEREGSVASGQGIPGVCRPRRGLVARLGEL